MPGSTPASATTEPGRLESCCRPVARPRGRRDAGSRLGVGLAALLLLLALLAEVIAPGDPFAPVAAPLQPPSAAHPMGTDDLGRDMLIGVVHGLRTSLLVAFVVTVLSAATGIGLGAIAGYRGGLIDEVLARAIEALQVVPRFLLAVVAIALLGPGLDRVAVLLGITACPAIARVARAEVLSLRTREFVEASRALGASGLRTLLRHVLPNALPALVVLLSLNAGSAILLEAGLSFLGLGDPALVSLGSLASNAQRFLRVAWWMMVFPGAAIALPIVALGLLGDALNEALQPRS